MNFTNKVALLMEKLEKEGLSKESSEQAPKIEIRTKYSGNPQESCRQD